ncbi:MAG TPA: putative PEP-binding protein, partial [Kofleriaceae bacterium]
FREVAQGMQGMPVTIRTFDLGADKHKEDLDGLTRVAPNPALGLRAIRFCLAEPRLFLTQLRAILRASHYGNVRILIPMLASMSEIDQTLVMIARAKESLHEQGVPFDQDVKVGGMIEIPAAVLAMGAFVRKLDFLSIGTNDLIQYTLAVDRVNEYVSYLYEPLHPALLRLIGEVAKAGHAANIPVTVCGEMAGEPMIAPVLAGLGIRELSMSSVSVPEVKATIRAMAIDECEALCVRIRGLATAAEVRAMVADYIFSLAPRKSRR